MDLNYWESGDVRRMLALAGAERRFARDALPKPAYDWAFCDRNLCAFACAALGLALRGREALPPHGAEAAGRVAEWVGWREGSGYLTAVTLLEEELMTVVVDLEQAVASGRYSWASYPYLSSPRAHEYGDPVAQLDRLCRLLVLEENSLRVPEADLCALLRCCCGEPGRHPRPGAASRMAAGMARQGAEEPYRDCEMAVLADVLEDAGCPSRHPALAHLRSAGPHARHCWVLRLILAGEK